MTDENDYTTADRVSLFGQDGNDRIESGQGAVSSTYQANGDYLCDGAATTR